MPYYPCLGHCIYDGWVDGIRVVWGPTAQSRLPRNAFKLRASEIILKSLTEHFLIASAKRLGCTQVTVLGAPHSFTTNSAIGGSEPDQDHISGRLSVALPDGLAGKGRYNVHVYLTDLEAGGAPYENVRVLGERVVEKNEGGRDRGSKNGGLRPHLSTGSYPSHRWFRDPSEFEHLGGLG
ncbi:hypothetical protein F5B18DRAFT_645324 [Nemania serpens]|nr:hypothetical protein F5B18DRAFT_645324 [Nemania serpens]